MHQRLIVLLAGLVFSSLGHAEVYCVDPTGTGGSGCGSTVFKTVGEVNNTLFLPGDQILFKHSGIWKEKLIAPSSGVPGNPITFGAYGEGEKPLLDGLVNPRNFGYSWIIAPDISAAIGGQVWYLSGGNPKLFTY